MIYRNFAGWTGSESAGRCQQSVANALQDRPLAAWPDQNRLMMELFVDQINRSETRFFNEFGKIPLRLLLTARMVLFFDAMLLPVN